MILLKNCWIGIKQQSLTHSLLTKHILYIPAYLHTHTCTCTTSAVLLVFILIFGNFSATNNLYIVQFPSCKVTPSTMKIRPCERGGLSWQYFVLLLCGGNWSFYIIPLNWLHVLIKQTFITYTTRTRRPALYVKWYHILLSLIHAIQYIDEHPRRLKKSFEQYPL